VIKQLVQEQSQLDNSATTIYTDGSKDDRGCAWAGFYSSDDSDLHTYRNYLLLNKVSAYTAELIATHEGLHYIIDQHITKAVGSTDHKVVITHHSLTHAVVLYDLYQAYSKLLSNGIVFASVYLFWLDAHHQCFPVAF